MAAKWNVSGYPAAATTGQTWAQAGAYLINGVETALSRFSGSVDPSTGAPTTWGADQVGYSWLDTTDADTTVEKVWQRLTTGPTAYGWRTVRSWKIRLLTTPAAFVFSPVSPATADVAATDYDLSTLLDSSAQDTGQLLPVVRAVMIRVRVAEAGTIPTGDNCYFSIKEKGSTNERRIYPQVSGRYVEESFWIGLDANEILTWAVDVGTGAPSFGYEAWIMAVAEAM